jgi:hypothetical protein
MFQPPSLLASQIVPTAAKFAGRPRLLRPGRTCFVTSARTGHAIRPLQAIGGERTFTFPDLRSCRLLQGPSLISDKAFTAHNLPTLLQILTTGFCQFPEGNNLVPFHTLLLLALFVGEGLVCCD